MRLFRSAMLVMLASFASMFMGPTNQPALAGDGTLAATDAVAHPEAVIIDYGNWCGYNNTREDPNYPAKDEVDAVCRTHDLCIRGYGYHDCLCDAAFLDSMRKAKASTWQGESYRVAAILAFAVKPCLCKFSLQADGLGGKCSL